jgi:uncharacterized protein YaiI (UPF0178 family)
LTRAARESLSLSFATTHAPTLGGFVTTLFIDADACPVTREAISAARQVGIPVVLVANGTQNLERHTRRAGVEAVQVSSGADAADFAVIERLSPAT